MQLTLAFFNPPDQPAQAAVPRAAAAWDDIDETSRLAALAILARLIAQMLAADQNKGTSND